MNDHYGTFTLTVTNLDGVQDEAEEVERIVVEGLRHQGYKASLITDEIGEYTAPTPAPAAPPVAGAAADVAFTADLLLCSHPSDRERRTAELLNYASAVWDTLPVPLREHLVSVAGAHADTRSDLPPSLRTALDVMGQRGRVVELTAAQAATPRIVVAYRNPDRPDVLLCRNHGSGWAGMTPLSAEQLPHGGICTYGRPNPEECGVDVLAQPVNP